MNQQQQCPGFAVGPSSFFGSNRARRSTIANLQMPLVDSSWFTSPLPSTPEEPVKKQQAPPNLRALLPSHYNTPSQRIPCENDAEILLAAAAASEFYRTKPQRRRSAGEVSVFQRIQQNFLSVVTGRVAEDPPPALTSEKAMNVHEMAKTIVKDDAQFQKLQQALREQREHGKATMTSMGIKQVLEECAKERIDEMQRSSTTCVQMENPEPVRRRLSLNLPFSSSSTAVPSKAPAEQQVSAMRGLGRWSSNTLSLLDESQSLLSSMLFGKEEVSTSLMTMALPAPGRALRRLSLKVKDDQSEPEDGTFLPWPSTRRSSRDYSVDSDEDEEEGDITIQVDNNTSCTPSEDIVSAELMQRRMLLKMSQLHNPIPPVHAQSTSPADPSPCLVDPPKPQWRVVQRRRSLW